MKTLKIIGFIILAIVAVLVILGFTLPTSYNVERSIVIRANEQLVKDQVLKFRNFHEWSPWTPEDPDMKVTYEGEDGTVGASMSWTGNESVGSGSQTITAITDTRADLALHFTTPYESNDNIYYLFEPAGDSIKVTWGMDGNSAIPMNIMMYFMGVEKMIGESYEKGLDNLKARCENMGDQTTFRGYEISEIMMEPKVYVALRDTVSFTEIPDFFAAGFGAIMGAMQSNGLQLAGAPVGIYYAWDMDKNTTDMAAAIPVSASKKIDGFNTMEIGGKALFLTYMGDFNKMEDCHYAMDDYMKAKGLEISEIVMEEYITDPMIEKDTSKWQTNVYYFIK